MFLACSRNKPHEVYIKKRYNCFSGIPVSARSESYLPVNSFAAAFLGVASFQQLARQYMTWPAILCLNVADLVLKEKETFTSI